MKLDDFRYMSRGKTVGSLDKKDAGLLASVEQEGAGRDRALLLLHGFSSSPAVYRRMIPELTMYDTVLCPTLPGHGVSIDVFSTVSAEDWIVSAEQACQRLMDTYQSVDVMGMSLGGVLACHLASRFQLNHLYLLAPALVLKMNVPLALVAARVLHRLGLRRIRNRAGNLHTNAYAELAYRHVPVSVIIQILSLIQRFQRAAPSCAVDVFLGRHDDVVDSQKVEACFIDAPNTRIHWLEHSAHVLPLDGDVDEILACVRDVCS